MSLKSLVIAGAIALGASFGTAQAQTAAPAATTDELIVQKRVFEMPSYTTLGGRTIRNLRIGYQTAGTLNADRSNAILITHFFSGNSHAFGRYQPGGPAGYWDAIIGPGRAIDTNRWFVISSDTLVNLNTGDPNTTTTGPASMNPDTGRPYGMDFPIVQIGDFVNVQRALVESLGIRRLHAVAGTSMGALQAYDWAARHPGMVSRIIPVIGAGASDAYLIAMLDSWAAPIRLDPNWNNGDYYGREAPSRGLAASLSLITFNALYADFLNTNFGLQRAVAERDPAAAMDNRYRIQQFLADAGAARARTSDANHLLYLVKANQLFVAGGGASEEALGRIRAPTLIIYSPNDLVFLPSAIERTRAAIAAGGATVETAEVTGPRGHLNGVVGMAPLAARITEFLNR
jgi:homoserine O-acetyltransferase